MSSLIRSVIDTAALRHNLQVARTRAAGARIMAVIKANAYGHGVPHAAKALAEADGFAVARLDEGLALRRAGLANRVLLLEGVFSPAQVALAAQQRFDLMVHSVEQLAMLEGYAGTERLRDHDARARWSGHLRSWADSLASILLTSAFTPSRASWSI